MNPKRSWSTLSTQPLLPLLRTTRQEIATLPAPPYARLLLPTSVRSAMGLCSIGLRTPLRATHLSAYGSSNDTPTL